MGTIAAPLLAVTSSGLLGLVLTSPERFRWTDAVSLVLTAAIFAFITAVQLTFWGKRFDVTRREIMDWWDDLDDEKLKHMAWEQLRHQQRFGVWSGRARTAYDAGILCLAASFLVMLVPPGEIDVPRACAIFLAVVAIVAEAAWIATAKYRPEVLDPPPIPPPEDDDEDAEALTN